MPTYLDRLIDATIERLNTDMRDRPFGEVDVDARTAPPARDFPGAIRKPGMSLVAEFKRRSPSKGQIRADLSPVGTAYAYETGGARAISVLTEPRFFEGSMDDLRAARSACSIPVLRKDFTIHPYQIAQARAGGADAILLIVAALPDPVLLGDLKAVADDYRIAALIEVHDLGELDTALEIDPEVIGVNQRNLLTFEVDGALALLMRSQIPAEVAMVAESGITSRAQVEELEDAGVDAVLVGETLMRAKDPIKAAKQLLGAA
jgi:indole-3-glycerol phosphate synthase